MPIISNAKCLPVILLIFISTAAQSSTPQKVPDKKNRLQSIRKKWETKLKEQKEEKKQTPRPPTVIPKKSNTVVPPASRPPVFQSHPANGSMTSASGVRLNWKPGENIVKYKVYFGTGIDKLKLLAQVENPAFTKLGKLKNKTRYYWRIDEVKNDGSVVTGKVWNFTTTTNLIGWWQFEETSRSQPVIDFSGNRITGVYQTGAAVGAPGPEGLGYAAKFNAGGVGINLGKPKILQNLRNNLTITAWVKPKTLNQRQRIIGSGFRTGGGWSFGIDANGGIIFTTWGLKDHYSVIRPVTAGVWNHVAVTMDSKNNVLFYLNGRQTGINVRGRKANTSRGTWYIGSAPGSTRNEAFDGSIDDVRVYNRALSGNEIMTGYKGQDSSSDIPSLQADQITTLSSDRNLLGWWRLEENSRSQPAVDSSGNGIIGKYQNGVAQGIQGPSGHGSAAVFNGTGEGIYLGEPVALQRLHNNFSLVAWIKPGTTSSRWRFVASSGRGGLGFGIDKGGALILTTWGRRDHISTTRPIMPNNWFHVAATMNSSNRVTFYVNGIQTGSTIAGRPTDSNYTTGQWYIGSASKLIEAFKGGIDDVRIYNRALTKNEIAALYRSQNDSDSKQNQPSKIVIYR